MKSEDDKKKQQQHDVHARIICRWLDHSTHTTQQMKCQIKFTFHCTHAHRNIIIIVIVAVVVVGARYSPQSHGEGRYFGVSVCAPCAYKEPCNSQKRYIQSQIFRVETTQKIPNKMNSFTAVSEFKRKISKNQHSQHKRIKSTNRVRKKTRIIICNKLN